MSLLSKLVHLIDNIATKPAMITIANKYAGSITCMRSPHVVCAIACHLMDYPNEEYYQILHRIGIGDYPSDDTEWYWIDNQIYIGPSIIDEIFGINYFVSTTGIPWTYHKSISKYNPLLWEGLSDETIIKLLKDKDTDTQIFGCKYIQYKLGICLYVEKVNSNIIKHILELSQSKDEYVLEEVISSMECIVRKKISKTELVCIKRTCMLLYVNRHIPNMHSRVWYILQYLKSS